MFFKKQSINQINIIAILFAGIFAFASAFVVIFNELRSFENEIEQVEKSYIQNQKKRTVEQASRLYRLIEYRYKQLKDKPKTTLYNEISKEIGVILDDLGDGSYIFVYDEKRRVVYESRYTNHNKEIIDDIMKVGQEGSGFLNFQSKEGKENVGNIAFIREFEALDWVIGSGVNISEIDRVLYQKRQEHQNKITSFILKIITLTLFLYLASILKYRYATDRIAKEIKFIAQSFKKASKNYTTIDRSKIRLEEFGEITSHANFMLSKIKEKKNALEELNANLESLVAEKTQELQESVAKNKELLEDQDRFVKNAIHEINTPLSVILMNIDLYNLHYEKNSYLIKIEAAVKVLENIYGDLSYIIKKDRAEHSVQTIDFATFITDRIEYFGDVALGNRLSFSATIQEDIFILFNEHELQRICDNNLSNAIKYSFANEVIYVRLFQRKNSVVFEVENRGETIQETQKLFNRYYREDEARGGFGLGLNIVKEICERNNIQIEVDSKDNLTVFRYIFEPDEKEE